MNFKRISHWFIFGSLILLLVACSDEAAESRLVDLHSTAAQDVISIQFPAETETVLSINSDTDLSVVGLKSNGVDSVSLTREIEWSLSSGSASSINHQGRISASPSAESITVYARLGILTASIDIRISAAKFDQVISLNEQPVTLDMCQSRKIVPVGKYIDASANEETRKVDNTVIGDIEWTILNAADNTVSQSAYIETVGDTTTLYSLAAGDLIIKATATSAYTGNTVTSNNLSQTIDNGLNSIRICSSSATDYVSCNVTSSSVEQDKVISFIAIGDYGSGNYQNISRTSKWGISNSNMSAVFSSNRQQINITGGEVPGEDLSMTSTLALACGDINQSITADITQGVILNSAIDCTTDCQSSSAAITIDQLSVSSFDVTANDNQLSSDEALTLDAQPDEIVLKTSVVYSNSDNLVEITDNSSLDYSIINIENQIVIEKTATAGTFKVLQAGTAKIQLYYRKKTFTALIDIP